jgi:hypothetical protein
MKTKSSLRVGAAAAMIAGLSLAGVAVTSPASAQAATCTGDHITPNTYVGSPLTNKLISNVPGQAGQPTSGPYAVNIPAGSYTTNLQSYDNTHPGSSAQPNEKWYAVFNGASGVVGTSSTTPDLADGITSANWPGGDLVLSGNATSVTYYHAMPTDSSPNSIFPSCVGLTLKAPYPIRPTVPAPDTTAAPVTTVAVVVPEVTVATTAPAKVDEKVAVKAPDTLGPIAAPAATAAAAPSPTAAPAAAPAPIAAPATTAAPTTVAATVKVLSEAVAAPEENSEFVAFTGAESTSMAAAAAGLFGLGAMLLVATRRRRDNN